MIPCKLMKYDSNLSKKKNFDNVQIIYTYCRNPTLAKCGGEAQHLEKVRIWNPLGLPNVQSSTARPKAPRIGVFLVSLKSSWSVDIENGLALAIWTSVAQVMGKKKKGRESNCQFDSRPLKVGNRHLPDLGIESAIRRWKDDDEGYKFGSDLVAIRLCSRELWAPKVPRFHPGQLRDNFGTPTRESREKEPFGCSPRNVAQRILYGGRWWLPPSPGRGESCGPKCSWLVPTPKGVPECELTTWVVCFYANSCLIY
jgi:hypothetical protein